ncbi:PepSY-associated TM helix domain-containing protein [Actinokineospora pegani]|uniref:PepSY-associated TM helix domain-containing protein n=1 Tax=Actinokineospora pegani TaxID=2654637 RepID=UPI0012EA95CF|nr:PepSY domain-containing protein [Actinokineospora pegani]
MTRARSTRTAVLLLARRVHYLAGLAIAPFLLLLALTGLCYACAPQLGDVLHADQLFAADTAEPPYPVGEQVRAALAAHPTDSVRQVTAYADPERTTQVLLADRDLPAGQSLAVHVDPYTAVVTGDYPTVDGRAPVQTWLGQMHTNLHLGQAGRLYAEFAVSWLPAVMLFGVLLWALGPKKRKQRLKSTNRKIRVRAWHGLVGLIVVAGLLAINFSGLTRSVVAGERVQSALGTRPGAIEQVDVVPGPTGPIGYDQVLATARDNGLTGDLTVSPPKAYDQPFKVSETSVGLPMRKGVVLIDQYRGTVVGEQSFADYSPLGKLRLLAMAAHHGTLFGVVNQVLLVVLAVAIIAVLVMGYRMWQQRKPAPTPPRALSKLPGKVLVPLVLICAALGWLMPVFGVTLVVFLLWDTAAQAAARAKAGRPPRRRPSHAMPRRVSGLGAPVIASGQGRRRRSSGTPVTPHPRRPARDPRIRTPV